MAGEHRQAARRRRIRGRRSARLSDAVLRGREIADVSAAKSAVALLWGKKMAELDGYIFVTAEYTHGLPAVLKNALDCAYAEYHRKPVHLSAMEAREPHERWSSYAWFLRMIGG